MYIVSGCVARELGVSMIWTTCVCVCTCAYPWMLHRATKVCLPTWQCKPHAQQEQHAETMNTSATTVFLCSISFITEE